MSTGLFFGSFNPVHIGHMALANYFIVAEGLKEVWFVVSPQNPLKEKASLLDERQRLHMVNLAIGDFSGMKASNIEFALPKPSFTIQTLDALQKKYPRREFALIMGSDNLENFKKWKNYEEILARHYLYVYPRPGYAGGPLKNHPHVKITQAPQFEISSTQVRKWIGQKKDVRFFMPAASWNYLTEMHFYKNQK
jgi:nicotinate-nucleotide adenylyltransferase